MRKMKHQPHNNESGDRNQMKIKRQRKAKSRFAAVEDVGLSDARPPWFEAGKYRVRVEKVAVRDGDGAKLWFVVEATVLEVYETENPRKMIADRLYSWVFDFNREGIGPANAARFLLAANGLDPDAPDNAGGIEAEDIEIAVADEQPLAGVELDLTCRLVKSSNGGTYTRHEWHPIEEDEDDDEDDDDDESHDERPLTKRKRATKPATTKKKSRWG